MGRSIDADALIKKLKEKSIVDEVNIISTTYTYKELVYIICNLPTAYDIEKVVAELEDKSSNYKKSYKSNGKNTYKTIKAISKNKAINIVRKGGVE